MSNGAEPPETAPGSRPSGRASLTRPPGLLLFALQFSPLLPRPAAPAHLSGMAIPTPTPGRRVLTREEALRRQKRLLVFGAVILAAQFINTLYLWFHYGRFPIAAGVAFVGVWVFYVMLLRQYRRVRALPPTPAERPGRKRKRLRDPHRRPQGRKE